MEQNRKKQDRTAQDRYIINMNRRSRCYGQSMAECLIQTEHRVDEQTIERIDNTDRIDMNRLKGLNR